MFKIALTAAALTLTTGLAQATPTLLDQPRAATASTEPQVLVEETAYYCEWAYVYDYYGNWVAVWQCF